MPVTFDRAGDVFEVFQGNGTFRVHHKGVDILDFRVTEETTPAPEPSPPAQPTPGNGTLVKSAAEFANAIQANAPVIQLAPGDYGDMPPLNDGITINAADMNDKPLFTSCHLNGKSNINLTGMYFKYNYTPGDGFKANRFSFVNCTDLHLDQMVFEGDTNDVGNPHGRGFIINPCTRAKLTNSTIFNWWTGGTVADGHDCEVSGNEIHTMLSDGFKIGRMDGLIVDGNYIHDFQHDPATQNHPDMIQIMRSSQLGSNNVTLTNNFFDQLDGTWFQTFTANQDQADLNDPAHQLYNLRFTDNVVLASQQHGCTVVGVASGVFTGNRMATIPRPDAVHSGAALVKMNIRGNESQITCTDNYAQVIQLNGAAAPNNFPGGTLDYVAERAAARVDPRWAHFFP